MKNIEFAKTEKGKKAKKLFLSLKKERYNDSSAIEVLRMYGYSNHFSTILIA